MHFDRDFAEISEKIEKSIGRRVKDTEAGQREILTMIENLSSKIDSLSGQASNAIDLDVNENHPESLIPTSKPIEVNELTRGAVQHRNSGKTDEGLSCFSKFEWRLYETCKTSRLKITAKFRMHLIGSLINLNCISEVLMHGDFLENFIKS